MNNKDYLVRLMKIDIAKATGFSTAAWWSGILSLLQVLSLVAAEWIARGTPGWDALNALIFYFVYFVIAVPNLILITYVVWKDVTTRKFSVPVYVLAVLVVLSWGIAVKSKS